MPFLSGARGLHRHLGHGRARRQGRGVHGTAADHRGDGPSADADLAATYGTLLERQGHRVTAVRTGADALAAAANEPFDAVLCDLGLPDMDGYQVARTLRARPGGDGLRLIAVSGFSRGTDRALSRTAGFDAHLAKPLPLAELLDLLERLGQA